MVAPPNRRGEVEVHTDDLPTQEPRKSVLPAADIEGPLEVPRLPFEELDRGTVPNPRVEKERAVPAKVCPDGPA